MAEEAWGEFADVSLRRQSETLRKPRTALEDQCVQICKASHGIIQTEVDDIIPDSFDARPKIQIFLVKSNAMGNLT